LGRKLGILAGDSHLTYTWNDVVFTNPIRVVDWEPPFRAAVYAIIIPAEKAGRFRLIYVGESGNTSERGFLRSHHKYPCWLKQARSDERIYIGLHLMPNSTAEQRRAVEVRAIGDLELACQG
jgi:hypothetical protein